MKQTLEGRIVETLVGREPPLHDLATKLDSPDAAYLVAMTVPEVRAELDGIVGDRHAGFTRRADNRTPFYPRGTVIGNNRQVSLVSIEELETLAAALGVPRIEAAWLGANLVVVGVPRLSHLPPATRLFFPDDATLVVTAENHPCVFPGKQLQARYPAVPGLDRAFPKYANGVRGLVAWVERAGIIRTGDTVRIALPAHVPYEPPTDDDAGE